MRGNNFSSRCGESINNNLKLKNLIANNSEDYINKATNFAKNKKLLNKFNGNLLRNNSLNSPLFDTSKFTFNFEKKMEDIYSEIYK